MVINVDENTHFSVLNKKVRESRDAEVEINGCIGQRYIATGTSAAKRS